MIIALASASGSPGVTTTALGLARVWPTPVLCIEADPTGGSTMLALCCGGFDVLSVSVVDLLLAARDGHLATTLNQVRIPLHESATASFLPGPRSHRQAGSIFDLWTALARHLTSLDDLDVIVDAGRLGLEYHPQPLMDAADLSVLVMGSTLSQLAAAKQWAEEWADIRVARPELGGAGLVVVGPGRPYSCAEIDHALPLPILGSISHDTRGAKSFTEGIAGLGGRRYRKSLDALAGALRQAGGSHTRMLRLP